MPDWINYISILIAVSGLLYAFWENRKKARIEELARRNNWILHQRANNANGVVQRAKTLYIGKHADNIEPEVIETISSADAFGQELYKETVRLVSMSEPSFVEKDFQRWGREGKLSEDKIELFRQFAVDAKIPPEYSKA